MNTYKCTDQDLRNEDRLVQMIPMSGMTYYAVELFRHGTPAAQLVRVAFAVVGIGLRLDGGRELLLLNLDEVPEAGDEVRTASEVFVCDERYERVGIYRTGTEPSEDVWEGSEQEILHRQVIIANNARIAATCGCTGCQLDRSSTD